eukprot:5526887-Alexandrium_andersonii.AAC.1
MACGWPASGRLEPARTDFTAECVMFTILTGLAPIVGRAVPCTPSWGHKAKQVPRAAEPVS